MYAGCIEGVLKQLCYTEKPVAANESPDWRLIRSISADTNCCCLYFSFFLVYETAAPDFRGGFFVADHHFPGVDKKNTCIYNKFKKSGNSAAAWAVIIDSLVSGHSTLALTMTT